MTDPREISLPGATLTATGIDWQGRPEWDQWLAVGQFLERAGSATQWWIGDWLLHGENRPEWGERYEQAISIFRKSYDTLARYKAVSRQIEFGRRRGNLPWWHHAEVANLPVDVQDELLDLSEPAADDQPPRLSIQELRTEKRQRQGEPREVSPDQLQAAADQFERSLDWQLGKLIDADQMILLGKLLLLVEQRIADREHKERF